jgi:hypothetical protein
LLFARACTAAGSLFVKVGNDYPDPAGAIILPPGSITLTPATATAD